MEDELLLIVAGAIATGLWSLLLEWRRQNWQTNHSDKQRRRELAELYLPQVLDLSAAMKWRLHELESSLGSAPFDNPYPEPPDDLKRPAHWYGPMSHLAHHLQMPERVRKAANALADQIERWNVLVEDEETGIQETEAIVTLATELVAALEEAAVTKPYGAASAR